jgi:hypothetical protein
MSRVIVHNLFPGANRAPGSAWQRIVRANDSSPEMQAFMERQAERRARAQEGVTRGDALMVRVVAAKKILKKRGELAYNGRASNANEFVKTMRASYGLALNAVSQGNINSHNDWMTKAREAESTANEAVNALERQASGARDYSYNGMSEAAFIAFAREQGARQGLIDAYKNGRISRSALISILDDAYAR